MAYKISDECISCGACEATCPVGAISAGDAHYQIDADTCISCGLARKAALSARSAKNKKEGKSAAFMPRFVF